MSDARLRRLCHDWGREAGAEAGCECGEAKPGLICRGELGCEEPVVLRKCEGITLECGDDS